MNYWLVRAKWGAESKKAEFINNDEWINGYEDKYLEIVKRVETEDILLLAEESTITHYGKCVDNPKDGKHLTVDKWTLLTNSIDFLTKDLASKAIFKITDNELIDSIDTEIENTKLSNDIKINNIVIENFTAFKNKHSLEFSDGLNIFIGENGTGKTHLIKLMYSLITCMNYIQHNPYAKTIKFFHEALAESIEKNLIKNFNTNELDTLITYNKNESIVYFYFGDYYIPIYIDKYDSYSELTVPDDNNLLNFLKKHCVFIPAKEILSFYEGFIPLYENREISFDEIYYNLAQELSQPLLKNIKSYPVEYKVLLKLEEILEGKILLENGRFYLKQNERKTEISLIAEGLRKIGMIAQLLANGSLTKNSILFWDEPETNLNPRLIRKMAEVLMELSRAGMQVFIATHSLFLVKEIEILRKKEDKLKYFGLGFDENKEIRVSQSEDFEYLDDIVILDEELNQDSRFLSKEEN